MIAKFKKIIIRLCKAAVLFFVLGTILFFLSSKSILNSKESCPSQGKKPSRERSPGQSNDDSSTNTLAFPAVSRDCSVPKDDAFPLCRIKFKEFKQAWNENCHGKKFRVNISDPCSILVYLSEVEPWCPVLPWRQHEIIRDSDVSIKIPGLRTDIAGLLELLDDKDFDWIRMRAQASWPEWVEAAKGLEKKENLQGRKRQRIVVFLAGVGHNTYILNAAFKGGPLGELVQWSDVICSLYILGHELIITTRGERIRNGEILSKHRNGCALKEVAAVDRIMADITGCAVMSVELGATYPSYKCKVLMLDSFGTEAEFNYAYYKPNLRRSAWGNLNANLQQFMTMFPHSPDNLFMGFAVPKKSTGLDSNKPTKKKLQGLIYGKDHNYYRGKGKYLDILHKYIELHSTLPLEDKNIRNTVPEYVINHGIVNSSELVRILQESKVFIGLGFPYEGPAPLDAVANGCFYINPKIIPPINRDNSAFYGGKPTFRKVTSQNPYAEDFIGKPYVYTIDINNDTEVENTIKEILASKEVPHLPYEFTHEGMLQRVNAFMENLDFCTPGHQWPPKSEMKILKGQIGKSCKDVCFNEGLLCEPSFFHLLNNIQQFKRSGFNCKEYRTEESIYAPFYNTTDGTCFLQDMPLLYSCVAEYEQTTRICPCRNYRKEQVALY